MPVGIFDSGLGGLTILAEAQKKLPDQAFVYFGDNANTPYGAKSADQISTMTRAGVTQLFAAGCDLVILACNTASAVALHDLQVDWLPKDKRVLGVFVPMIEELTRRDWGDNTPPTHTGLRDVALFATPATVASGAFARELKFRARDVDVVSQACDGLVAAIEKGDAIGTKTLVKAHVNSLLQALPAPQAAVLGCTHFPLVEAMFRAVLPAGTKILSQPGVVADSLADYLARHPRFVETGDVTYLTSGDPAAISDLAAQFLGHTLPFRTAD
ncbi:MAG: aspartate/glutamate racemase family protein [Paracoccaceae bacterium]